jgi:divalent metal cation (Fe/Co/Zn/Cd) transporter
MLKTESSDTRNRLLNTAMFLSIITIFYNIAEGTISTLFGYSDETLALFGFGVDSFVEVISGLGIAHMIFRMKRSNSAESDHLERTALYITGASFYILTIGLTAGAVLIIAMGIKPESTVIGIIVSALSIITMYILYRYKLKTGQSLNSAPIIADANCTKTCFYLSFVLMGSSIIFYFSGVAYIDAIGSIGIAYFAFKEGRESFEKARTGKLTCCCGDGCS